MGSILSLLALFREVRNGFATDTAGCLCDKDTDGHCVDVGGKSCKVAVQCNK